jgi:uncharacterized protein YjbI with pentapeptide repeats
MCLFFLILKKQSRMNFNKNTFLHENKTFEKVDFANQVTQNKEFEQCTFRHCDFSQLVLANNVFSDCSFVNCNLSNVNFNNASLKNVAFKDCKLLGIIFSEVKDFLFNIHLENCNADFASFANKKMSKTKFINTSLKDVNFAGTVLNNALFDNCNLENALFNKTNLKEANLETSYNYIIDPELNDIKKCRFSLNGLMGLLAKYDIVV